MKIALLGPPGAGKGTYAVRLKDTYGLKRVSMGDVIRDQIKKKTKTGLKIEKYVEAGDLIPDGLVTEMFKHHLKEVGEDGLLLDGFPRTIGQARELDKILKLDHVLMLKVSDDVIIDRLSGRRVCPKCKYIYHVRYIIPKKEGVCDYCGTKLVHREDDRPEAIKERLRVQKPSDELIGFYEEKGVLHYIDANRPMEQIDEIMADFAKVLG